MSKPTDDQTIQDLDGIVGQLVKDFAPAHFDSDTREEMKQELRVHLWAKSLPKFDPTIGASITTFAYSCGRNFLITWLRRKATRDTHGPGSYDPEVLDQSVGSAGPASIDGQIQILVMRMATDGAGLLTPRQAEVVRFVVANPGISSTRAARKLGYKRVKSYDAMQRQIRERIMACDISELN